MTTSTPWKYVLYEPDAENAAVVTITVNRPEVMNVISRRTYAELDEAFEPPCDVVLARDEQVARHPKGRHAGAACDPNPCTNAQCATRV